MVRVRMMAAAAGLAALLAGCSGGEQVQAASGDGWELVWSDEFDGDGIDPERWSFETNCWGGGNDEQQCYTDREDNAFVEDGQLVIRALEEEFTGPAEPLEWGTDAGDATLPYTSARLTTRDKGDWTYGRIEVGARLPGGQGVWPAIWMLPTDSVYGEWAASGEIDIMEAVNLGTEEDLPVHGTIHYGGVWPDNAHSGEAYAMPTDPREELHTYAIEWADGEIRWYVDDVLFATRNSLQWHSETTNEAGEAVTLVDGEPFDQRFHLLLNVAIGGNWPGPPDASTELPVEMTVDFVRVWSCPDSPETLEACTAGDEAP